MPGMYDHLINCLAYYRGNRRSHIMNRHDQYLIVDVRKDGQAVQFSNGEWVGINSIELADNASLADWEKDLFNAAAGGKEAMLDVEIKRLEERLTKLKMAREVLDSL